MYILTAVALLVRDSNSVYPQNEICLSRDEIEERAEELAYRGYLVTVEYECSQLDCPH